jgi:hypothetical protein
VVEKPRAGWKALNDANRVVWNKHVQRDRDAAEAIRQTQEQQRLIVQCALRTER